MKQYHDALTHIIENGEDRTDRTGVGTRSVFGYQMRFDLSEGFPAVTTKKLAWKSVVSELLWFLEGSTDERRLAEILYKKQRQYLLDKKTIWTANADKQGLDLGYVNTDYVKFLGPIYGHQWRGLRSYDQIENVIDQIKNNPDSRRIILNSWNVNFIDQMALPPCHTLVQFYVRGDKLDCQLYQRSADMFLGVPFNIASYALLTHMIARHCTLKVGDFVHTLGDAHIYSNHMDVVHEQLKRKPKKLPQLKMPDIDSFDVSDIKLLSVDDFVLEGYEPMEPLNAPMAV